MKFSQSSGLVTVIYSLIQVDLYMTLLVPAALFVTSIFLLVNWGAFKFFRHN